MMLYAQKVRLCTYEHDSPETHVFGNLLRLSKLLTCAVTDVGLDAPPHPGESKRFQFMTSSRLAKVLRVMGQSNNCFHHVVRHTQPAHSVTGNVQQHAIRAKFKGKPPATQHTVFVGCGAHFYLIDNP